jgi:GNAT superfamily N-acetyltransferase
VPEPSITLATPAHRRRVVATVMEAFRDDPAFNFFFPDDYDREAAAFAGLLFDTRAAARSTWVVDDGAAVAMWDRPRPPDAGRDDDLHGTLGDIVSPATIERIDRYEEAVDHRLPSEPHWYLGILATDPAVAGRRFGRLVKRVGLLEAAREGTRAALETTNPGNVARYRAEGWTVHDEVTVDDVLHVWILVHEGITGES